jgi:hypothetical protein
MNARPEDTLTDDELAAQAAEPLPDREVDWQGGDAETAPDEEAAPENKPRRF